MFPLRSGSGTYEGPVLTMEDLIIRMEVQATAVWAMGAAVLILSRKSTGTIADGPRVQLRLARMMEVRWERRPRRASQAQLEKRVQL